MKRKRQAPAPAPQSPAAPAPPAWGARAVCAASFILAACLGLAFIRSAAPTYDEPLHLASGYSYLMTGRYRLNITDHPPLAEMWAALPLLALHPSPMTSHPDFQALRRYPFADTFLYRNSVDPERMLNAARDFAFLTLSAALFLVLVLWARRAGGWEAAAGTAAAAALCPVLLSNLALVTTDGLPAVLFAAVFWLLARPSRPAWVWAAAGTLAGLGLASKFNMILLAAMVPGFLFIERGLHDQEPPGMGRVRGAALGALCAFVALTFVYRFDQLGLFVDGLRDTTSRLGQGRASYLLGSHSVEGAFLYFPAALFAKTPLPLLGLAAWGAVLAARSGQRAALWLLAPTAAYLAVSMTSKVQIGVRHLLPVFPFLCLWAGLAAADLWRRGTAARAALAALALWGGVSVWRAQPNLLSYFNEAAGGPAGGWRWLADSNLDWGQDLKGLADEIKRRGNPPIYLAYFGVGDPSYYGLRFVQALANWNVPRPGDRVDPAKETGKVLFAVSVTNRVGVYLTRHDIFDWLAARTPVATPGHSIFLYDLTADADGRRRLAELLQLTRHPDAAGLSQSLLIK